MEFQTMSVIMTVVMLAVAWLTCCLVGLIKAKDNEWTIGITYAAAVIFALWVTGTISTVYLRG